MKVGIPREIKNHEYRVAITPSGVHELIRNGHEVVRRARRRRRLVHHRRGLRRRRRADPRHRRRRLGRRPTWCSRSRSRSPRSTTGCARTRCCSPTCTWPPTSRCTDALLAAGTTGIAYETVQLPDGSLPLLAPMSEVAGRLAPQVGSYHLMRQGGGRGVLMGGVPGVYAAKVVVIGAGVSGQNAAAIALGMQAEVLLLDRNVARLRQMDAIYQGHCQTIASNAYEVERAVLDADLVIGAVLVPGAKAPKIISNELVSRMKPGSVLVDISIDQGGCFEDSRPTTHAEPTFQVHDSVFYCVANMPGAVPHTSTYALTNVTLPYAVELANRGWRDALRSRPRARARPEHPRRPAHQRPGRRGARLRRRRPGRRARLSRRWHNRRRLPQLSLWFDQTAGPLDAAAVAGRGADRTVDVAIVGAGYTGLWTAYYLQAGRPDAADRDRRGARSPASARPDATAAGARRCTRCRVARWPPRPGTTRPSRSTARCATAVTEVGRVAAAESIDADIATRRHGHAGPLAAAAGPRPRRGRARPTRSASAPALLDAAEARARLAATDVLRRHLHAALRGDPAGQAGPRAGRRGRRPRRADLRADPGARRRTAPGPHRRTATCAPTSSSAPPRVTPPTLRRQPPRGRPGLLADHRHRTARPTPCGTRSGCASGRRSATTGT